jgi:ribose 5-phosphate isomerase B
VALKVFLGSDHGGYELKEDLKKFLDESGYHVVDYGSYSADPVDYPDIALLVAETVSQNPGALGIIIDGAGIGSAITANKVPGIRAAHCHEAFTAKNSREHNDANILTLGGRVIGAGLARDIVKVWLSSCFLGDRHARRVEKMMAVERKYVRENFSR